MAYSSAVFYLDYEGGSDAARTALTAVAVANNGAGVRCTKAAHGLVTGAVVDVSLNYAGAWMVVVINSSTFDLVGSTYSTATACTVTPRGGSSKADAWKTITSGATSARIAPGDTIRLMASPEPTLLGNATWTQYNRIITLANAVTANISDCEIAWTASTNVTCTADTGQFREGTKSMKAVIATAFTTGKVCYFPTGMLDLSAYQQVSFMLFNTVAIATGSLSLRLCSDTLGVTTVHTIPLPAVPSTSNWLPVVVNLGANMNSAIASIALYQDVDIAAVNIQIDNIIACKAASSADSLTHQSIVGKSGALSWTASTIYGAGESRKPTPPNRTGFRYAATSGTSGAFEPLWPQEYGLTVADGTVTWTCIDLEESWHALQSVNGTTLILDGQLPSGTPSIARGYDGITETIATHKRETTKFSMVGTTAAIMNQFQVSGTSSAPIIYSGGWDRTTMSNQSGETWFDPLNGNGYFLQNLTKSYLTIDNINIIRYYIFYVAIGTAFGSGNLIKNAHANYGGAGFSSQVTPGVPGSMSFAGFQTNGSSNGYSTGLTPFKVSLQAVKFCSSSNGNHLIPAGGGSNYSMSLDGCNVVLKNAAGWAILGGSGDINIRNLVTANNVSGVIAMNQLTSVNLTNSLIAESSPFPVLSTNALDRYIYSQNHQQSANNHYIQTDGGTIISATDQRHTASGISWKFRPTSLNRGSSYPLRLSIAKIACAANTTVNVQIWTRRDSVNIVGRLKIAGGQIAGVGTDLAVMCAPAINTWVLSAALTFAPTAAGVIEVMFECYDGVGTTNNFWIDDLSVS